MSEWVTIVSGSVTLRYNGVALQLCDTARGDVLITLAAERLPDLTTALDVLAAALKETTK